MEKQFTREEAIMEAEALLTEAGFEDVRLRFGTDGVHIENSCLVRKSGLRLSVCRILERTEGFSRTAEDLSAEWLGHNAFYRVTRHPGAKSADLEFTGDKRSLVRIAAKVMAKLGIR